MVGGGVGGRVGVVGGVSGVGDVLGGIGIQVLQFDGAGRSDRNRSRPETGLYSTLRI